MILGTKHSEKSKKDMSESHKEWHKKNIHPVIHKGHKLRLGKTLSKKTKKIIGEKNSKKIKEAWRDPLKRGNMLKNRPNIKGKNHYMYGKHHTEEYKIQGSNFMKELWKDQKYKELQIKKHKEWHKNNPHPKGMLGKKQTKKQKRILSTIMKGNIYGFKKGDIRITGKNNVNWNNGSSFEPYDLNWTNKFKRSIRRRDNQICQICKIHREKLNTVLSVHHINGDKKMSMHQNCISLCPKCHALVHNNKTENKKEEWIKFFQSLLNKNYDYQYSNNEIILEIKNEI